MTIKGNNSSGLVSVASADTTILNNSTTGRWAVVSINLHDYGATGDTVEIFVSDNAASAAAERIDKIVLAVDESKNAVFQPVVLYPGEYLLAKGATGGTINIEAIYIAYSGSS